MCPTPAAPLALHYTTSTPVEGLAVAERRVGSPEATLLCIHGGLDRAGSFSRLARRLDNFDVVSYDRRGYQRSRNLTPLSLDRHISDLLAITEVESAKGPVIYLGHSYGGLVALGAAVAQPLASMVITYESPLPWVLPRQSGRPPLGDDPAKEVENFFTRMVSKSAWQRLSDAERESRRLDGPALLSDLTILTQEPPFDIRQLKVPTSYVHGDGVLRDYYRALSLLLSELNNLISPVEITNAGHGAHLANPDQLATLIQQLWEHRCE
ncbi:MAG: alpha/beta hydrolase [Acidimicrobiales bacterium]|jgi:pimeloyl-ACP methyl ester carboxylesterase